MANSMNPNRGHYNPPPTITYPKTPAPDKRQDDKSSTGKVGRS